MFVRKIEIALGTSNSAVPMSGPSRHLNFPSDRYDPRISIGKPAVTAMLTYSSHLCHIFYFSEEIFMIPLEGEFCLLIGWREI